MNANTTNTTASHLLLCFFDRNLGQVMAEYLEHLGFITRLTAEVMEDGVRRELEGRLYDAVIVYEDTDLNTLTQLSRLREMSDVPAYVVLSKPDKILWEQAFGFGADDVLETPISSDIIALKIRALLRRLGGQKALPTLLTIGSLTFDAQAQTLTTEEGTVIRLSGKENDLLQLLAVQPGELVERSYILRKVWREDTYFNSRSLSVYVNHLRHILEVEPKIRIFSVHNKGYKLSID